MNPRPAVYKTAALTCLSYAPKAPLRTVPNPSLKRPKAPQASRGIRLQTIALG